jgi:glycosyltransferase involved in cell wall biosynthesis
MKYWDGPDTIARDGLILHGLCRARPLYTASGRRSITQALVFGLSTLKLVTADFDVIDCCGFPYFSLFSCKLATIIRRKPLNVTWHEVWGRNYWKTYLGRLGILGYLVERLASKMPDHIIAASPDTARELTRQLGYQRKVSIIPNGVDAQVIQSAATSPSTSDVIYVGRLVDFKHVDHLIQAFALVKKDYPEATCTIVGDGPMRHNLEALAQSLGLATSVRFTGFVEASSDVYGLMKASKVFVLPSSREGFGISVIEANAAGLPAITTNYPGNAAKDLISKGRNGLVCEPTPEALASGIKHILKSRNSFDPRIAANEYDWQAITLQTQVALDPEAAAI